MAAPTLYEIAEKLNELSKDHPIGQLQAIRGSRPRHQLFTVFNPGWAFHWGGRTELQFHIGLDEERRNFSHGVAFSFKDSRSYTSDHLMKLLLPKVKCFNDFLREHRRTYRDMGLWIWDGPGGRPRSRASAPTDLRGRTKLPLEYEQITL